MKLTIAGLLALAATIFSSGIAHAENCYTDCYQNGTQYQCTTNCY